MLRFYLLLALFPIVECAKIGVFTVALSNSQMVFVLRIAEALAEDGHEVVVVRPEYNPTANSVKSSNSKIRDIFVKAAPLKAFEEYSRLKHRENFEDWTLFEYRELSKAVKNLVIEGCSGMLSNDEFIQQIKDEHFDLVFHGHLDFCLHGIAHHAGIRKWVTTMPMPLNAPHMRELQLPYFNSFLPGLIQNTTMYMSFVERAQTAFGDFFYGLVSASIIETPTTMLLKKKFGENFIAVSELRKQAILSFVNSDPFLEYPIPVTNKVQYIGGLGTKNPKELKEPFLSFAEKAKSVVVVSFGSVVTAADMPESWKEALLGLFRMNPEISFVWKFEEDIEVPKNVLRTKWFPQNDLLALNKTQVFITHGGYNSLGEAVQSATPCVFVPLATDQLRNSMLGQYRGIGVQLPKRELSAASLHKKLHLILSNSSFRDAAKRYQTLGNSRINSPEEILRHWTNLILNHDLDLNLPNLSLVQLYNLDVYAFFFLLLIGFLFVLRTLWKWYCWSCCEMAYIEKEKLS